MPRQDREPAHSWVNAKVRKDSYAILTKAAKANRRSLSDFCGIVLESVAAIIDLRKVNVDPLMIRVEIVSGNEYLKNSTEKVQS